MWILQWDQVYRYNMIDLISFTFCWLPNYIVDISQPFVSQARLESIVPIFSSNCSCLLIETVTLKPNCEVDFRENNYVLAHLYSKNFSCYLFHNITILLFSLFSNFDKTIWWAEFEKNIVWKMFQSLQQKNVRRHGSSFQLSVQSNYLQ